jgi:hypothetical protein
MLSRRSPLLVLLALVSLVASLASAHMIELPAGKRECYFEDLHTEDKVRLYPARLALGQHVQDTPESNELAGSCASIDDGDLPGRRRWSPGRRLLGSSSLPLLLPPCPALCSRHAVIGIHAKD